MERVGLAWAKAGHFGIVVAITPYWVLGGVRVRKRETPEFVTVTSLHRERKESNMPGFDRLLRPREAAELLSLSPSTLASWRSRGRGPAFVRLGAAIRYRMTDLEDYLTRGGSLEDDPARESPDDPCVVIDPDGELTTRPRREVEAMLSAERRR
jgi:predicted DNA-binding transcriptional regulator AlpA